VCATFDNGRECGSERHARCCHLLWKRAKAGSVQQASGSAERTWQSHAGGRICTTIATTWGPEAEVKRHVNTSLTRLGHYATLRNVAEIACTKKLVSNDTMAWENDRVWAASTPMQAVEGVNTVVGTLVKDDAKWPFVKSYAL
jgi:hypothetical protein